MGADGKQKTGPGLHQKLSEDTQFEGVLPNVFQTALEGFQELITASSMAEMGTVPSSKVTHTKRSKFKQHFKPATQSDT